VPGPIALDAMGGDHAPEALVRGAATAVEQGIAVLLVGDRAQLEPLIPSGLSLPILHASERIEDSESPSKAVRRKPDASINLAIQAVVNGKASAAVSCGHTGAAMASSLFGLGRTPGVERPAIATVLPRADGGSLVLLDLGANVDCKPSHLAQFALMGHAFARVVLEQDAPRVALVSNGSEERKGNEQVRAAAELVARLPLDFKGFVEPQDALKGACEVLVCDGFVGNVMLKSVEATASVAGQILRREIGRHRSARLGAWLLQGALRRFRDQTDHAQIGGALLIGVTGVVVVGHGRSDQRAVTAAIQLASRCVDQSLAERLGHYMEKALG
jgi:glycerol-3-phosphate acyltransferase PlsX